MKTKFIGRRDELKRIHHLLEQGPSCALISIFGAGGVGKTTLVEQVVQQVQQAQRPDRAAVLVDFDLPRNRTLSAVRRAIVDALGAENFVQYQAKLRELEEMEARGMSYTARAQAAQRAEQAFQHAQEQALTARRLLLALDTVERIQESAMFDELLDFLHTFDNVVVLVAGRRNQSIEPTLRNVYPAFHPLPIEPLDDAQSQEYLRQTLAAQLDAPTLARLSLLAQGKPILLDLAATWLDRRLKQRGLLKADPSPAGDLLQMPLDHPQERLQEYRGRFEFELVSSVRALSSPLDWAVLYMALLEHPCSAELWQHLLDLDHDAAQQLMDDLTILFFVRADHSLHDEMRVLVLRHVWPYIDPRSDMRQTTLQRLLDFRLAHKSEEPGWDRWFHEAEELHYRLALDIANGHRHFLDQFNYARDRYWTSGCQLLVQTIRRPQHWPSLTPPMQLEARVCEAQLYTFIGQDTRMEHECQQILDDPQASNAAKIDALCAIAYGQLDYNPQASAANYERALELARKGDNETAIANILNLAGRVYRRLGLAEKAIQYFERSIQLSHQHQAWLQKAAAQNNLAYVCRQNGDLDRALNLARMAFVTRSKLADQRGLAYSHQTIGEIYRDQNDLIAAESRFVDARQIFERLGAERDVARLGVDLANLYRKRHEPNLVEHYLNESLAVFEKTRNDEGRAWALNEYGCELRKRGCESSRTLRDLAQAEVEFRQAEAYFQESENICRQTKNWYRLADNLADLALLYCYWFQNYPEKDREPRRALAIKAQDAAYQAIAISRRHSQLLQENRAIESLGNLYYAQGQYFKAFAQFYTQACLNVAQHYDTTLWRYNVVFDRVHRRLLNPEIPDEQVRFIAAYLARRWREEGKETVAAGFAQVYQDIAQEWAMGMNQ